MIKYFIFRNKRFSYFLNLNILRAIFSYWNRRMNYVWNLVHYLLYLILKLLPFAFYFFYFSRNILCFLNQKNKIFFVFFQLIYLLRIRISGIRTNHLCQKHL